MKKVKQTFDNILDWMKNNAFLFVKTPERDFTRNGKLPLDEVIRLVLSFSGTSLPCELTNFYDFDTHAPSPSALIQKRKKLRLSAFRFPFETMLDSYPHFRTFKGYRLLATDGSSLNIAKNPQDLETYFPKGWSDYNQLHLDALYDLENNLYIKAKISAMHHRDERQSLIEFLRELKVNHEKIIVIADRGYESYNILAHLEAENVKYVIRAKSPKTRISMLYKRIQVNKRGDKRIKLTLTRQQTKKIKENPHFKTLRSQCKFDFLPPKSKDVYDLSYRVISIPLEDGTFEYLLTNLSKDEFSAKELKQLYIKRWGIETSFRSLKHTVGLSHLHSKRRDLSEQEIYARLIMYNLSSLISSEMELQKSPTKYDYHINFKMAVQTCKALLRRNPPTWTNIEGTLRRHLLPVRKNRKAHRQMRSISFISFNYRVA